MAELVTTDNIYACLVKAFRKAMMFHPNLRKYYIASKKSLKKDKSILLSKKT
ncbi:MAG: hypothetical protein Q8Q30_00725 [Candidatus Woesebacteria bacterium]|nr:hypothetical protein [Candidatus Woesebacteria bacterium]